MHETHVLEQAKAIASQLLTLTREIFAPDHDAAADLPVAQLRVCGILYGGPRPMSALSRELGISFSATTQIADRLERARLVRRVAQGTDRRAKRLELTLRGEKIMRQREQHRIARVSALLEHLPAPARAEVQAALDLLVRACMATKEQTLLAEMAGQ